MKNQMQKFWGPLLLLFIFSPLGNLAMAQSSIGLNFGVPRYTLSNDANAPFITSESTGSYAIGLEFQQNIQKSITWGIDVSIHKITNTIRTNSDYTSYSAGIKPIFNLGFTPKLIYNKAFGESKFGGFLTLGPSLQWNNGADRELNETNFRIVGKKELDANGNWSILPLEQSPYTAQERTNKISVVIRSEAGLTFSVSDYSKFSVRFQYGIGIGESFDRSGIQQFPAGRKSLQFQKSTQGGFLDGATRISDSSEIEIELFLLKSCQNFWRLFLYLFDSNHHPYL